MNILLIEDNDLIIKGLKYSLETNNYKFHSVTKICDAKKYLISDEVVDLVILDIMLPDGNGFDLFLNVIKDKDIPTIFLTAKDDEISIVKGLNIGAEDYITKPFSTNELLARIQKVLSRTKKNTIITVNNIKFDIDKMVCYKDNIEINLTPLEIRLLHILFIHLNKTVSRSVILDKILELTGNYVDDHTVTVYFKRIREKLGTDIIKTIKGIGYRIDNE